MTATPSPRSPADSLIVRFHAGPPFADEATPLSLALRKRLAARHELTSPDAPTTPVDTHVHVVVHVHVSRMPYPLSEPDPRFATAPPDPKGQQIMATAHAVDLFGVEIGSRRVTYYVATGPSDEQLEDLLGACSGEALEAYARLSEEERARRAIERVAAEEKARDELRQRQREDAERTWNGGRLQADCRLGRTKGACDALERFVLRYPMSPYRAEAEKTLDARPGRPPAPPREKSP